MQANLVQTNWYLSAADRRLALPKRSTDFIQVLIQHYKVDVGSISTIVNSFSFISKSLNLEAFKEYSP